MSGSSRQRKVSFFAALLPGVTMGLLLVWKTGAARMARRQVSPRGGNELAFSLMRSFLAAIMQLLGPLTVSGQEHVPASGPLLVVSNHLSNADVPAMGVALPRWAWFMAAQEVINMPVLGRIFQFLHAYPIRRDEPDRQAMKWTLELLRQGEAVVIFAEGEEAERHRLQPFHDGAAMLAIRSNALVVPAAITGTEKIMPYGSLVPRPAFSRVNVRFGQPVDLSDLPEERHARLQAATARIRSAVASLLKEIGPQYLPDEERA